MGYWVSKLKNIPTSFDWYFFLVGDYRNHSFINDLFRDDFAVVSDRIGDKSAIIAQNNMLEEDLQRALKDIKNGKLGKMIRELEERSPGLLVMNKHPSMLTPAKRIYEKVKSEMPNDWSDLQKTNYLNHFLGERQNNELEKDSVLFYIPFTTLENVYSSTNLLISDLVEFSKGINNNLIKKTSRIGTIQHNISTSISLNLGLVAINFEIG